MRRVFVCGVLIAVGGGVLCAQHSVQTTSTEVNSRDKKFNDDIREIEKEVENKAKAGKLSAAQKAALYHVKGEAVMSSRGTAALNNAVKATANPELAAELFSKEIKLMPNPQAYHLRGVAYKQLRRYAEALADFSVAIDFKTEEQHYPFGYSRAEAYRLRSSVYLLLGKPGNALSDINGSISLDAKNTYAYGDRCAVLQKLGRMPEAAKDAETFLNSTWISERDKNAFSGSGQCFAFAKASIKVKGCKDSVYFDKWEQEQVSKSGTE